MKKTLIALTVAVSSAISGSAMANAWDNGGSGGSVNLGGSLTPVDADSVWEVKVGTGSNNLDAEIASGQQNVDITLSSDLLVLGVRSVAGGFTGGVGLSPQLDYGGALDTSSFQDGKADLTLDVTDTDGNHIGSLSTKLVASGIATIQDNKRTTLIATQEGHAFWGGIPGNASLVTDATALAARVDSTVTETFLGESYTQVSASTRDFTNSSIHFSAYYLSALLTDNPVTIELDNALDSAVNWKAQLPVIVSYQ